MKEKVVFNFFDRDKTMTALCKYFNLHKIDAERYLIQRKLDEDIYFDFIKYFNIPVDKLDTSTVSIKAKHITTFHDNGLALKRYGLLNLKKALEQDTPLKQFLIGKSITFDVDNKNMTFRGNKLKLFLCNDHCKSCIIDKNTCSEYSQEYKNAITCIYKKFYLDKCEIEVFLSGNDEELRSYSNSIARYPELLRDIDILLRTMKNPLNLANEWEKLQNNEYYILEFDVSIDALEKIPDSIKHEKPSYYGFEEYFNLLGYAESDFYSKSIPERFIYRNVWLVKNSIDVFINGKGKELGQIFPELTIPYGDLRIFKKTIGSTPIF